MSDHEWLFLREVVEDSRLSPATIYRMIKVDRFPKPIRIGLKRIAWLRVDYQKWKADRSAERWSPLPSPNKRGRTSEPVETA